MKKFITLSLLFCLPILTLLIVSDVLLRNIPNDYSYKRSYLDSKSNEIEVLYLGSSHVYFGINPEYSKFSGFNASHISQSLNFDLSILKKYKNNWSNLKCIVIAVDYFSLYYVLENGGEEWRVKNYSIYYNIHESSNYKANFEILNGQFRTNLARLKSYYINFSTDITCNKLGWGINYNSKNGKNLLKTGKIAAKRHTTDIDNNLYFENSMKILNAFIEFAKSSQIKIIFYTNPAYQTYMENLNQKQLHHTINSIIQISSKNSNSAYYNLLNDKSFIAEDFYDADHLNEKGAKKLTYKIDSLMISGRKSTNVQQAFGKKAGSVLPPKKPTNKAKINTFFCIYSYLCLKTQTL